MQSSTRKLPETPLDEDSAEQPVPLQPLEEATCLPSFMFQSLQEMGVTVKSEDHSQTNTSESAKGNGVLSLPSEPGTVPKALGVGQHCGSAASSTEPGPVPKALNSPETGTGGQPDTKSACTPPTNTKDSETQEENTSREVNTSQEVNTAYEEKAMPLKPLEDNLINLLNEAKDHLCIYYAFKFYVTIYFIYIYVLYAVDLTCLSRIWSMPGASSIL